MFKILLKKKAQDALDRLFQRDKDGYKQIIAGLLQLEKLAISADHVKNIGDDIFRKRTGRWRILFTQEEQILSVWIIEQEKDTEKDYRKWKGYIIEMLKFFKDSIEK